MTKYRTITAKFASFCNICNGTIIRGSAIRWAPHAPPAHVGCMGDDGAAVPESKEAASARDITTLRTGRRTYLHGNTYPVRGLIRGAAGNWDGDKQAWWFGSDSLAKEIAEQARTATAEAAAPRRTAACVVCGDALSEWRITHGCRTCSSECTVGRVRGTGWSGYVGGQ